MNQKLGSAARAEIRKAVEGLAGTALKQEVERQAADKGVSVQYIYKMTAGQRNGTRKKRSDAGHRTFELVEGTDVWTAAQLVISDKLDPAVALLTCRTRDPQAKLPSLEYFRKILAANGLGKKARRSPRTAFRRWEAELPGEMFQIDVTALKERWRDEKTRRIMQIEGVDKNHPQMDPAKLRVWQILLVDDHSRRRFLRYFVARAITSDEMVRFMCEAYSEIGVPRKLYTDQGGEFKGRHRQAAKIFNKLLEDDGGYVHIPHAPHNAKATGKVENGHQWAEKMDRLIGLADTEGQAVTLEMINTFADRICSDYNNRIHRQTGETPMARWHGKRIVVRRVPREIIESALLSDEFPCFLDPSMTVTRNGVSYKVPGVTPFVDYVGRKVLVVVPPSIDIILLTLPNAAGKFEPDNGGEYEIEKVIATADKAGEFKSVADSTAQEIEKRLKETRKAAIKEMKAQKALTGEIAPVPFLNVEIEQPVTNVANFPHAERIVTPMEIAAVLPVPETVLENERREAAAGASIAYAGRDMSYWEAVVKFQDRFEGGTPEAREFLLSVFPDMKGTVPSLEVEAAIDGRFEPQRIPLRAVS